MAASSLVLVPLAVVHSRHRAGGGGRGAAGVSRGRLSRRACPRRAGRPRPSPRTWPRPTWRSSRRAPATAAGTGRRCWGGQAGARRGPARPERCRAFTWCSWRTARAWRRTGPSSTPRAPTGRRGWSSVAAATAGWQRASPSRPVRSPPASAAELIPGFEPETALERAVAVDPRLLEGLAWGKPRRGAPGGRRGRPRGGPARHDRPVGRDGHTPDRAALSRARARRVQERGEPAAPEAGGEPPRDARPAPGRGLHGRRAPAFGGGAARPPLFALEAPAASGAPGPGARGHDARADPGSAAVHALRGARRVHRRQAPRADRWLREEIARRGLDPG